MFIHMQCIYYMLQLIYRGARSENTLLYVADCAIIQGTYSRLHDRASLPFVGWLTHNQRMNII